MPPTASHFSYELVKPLVVGTYSTIYLVNKFVEGGPSVKMAMKAENADVNSESTGYALAVSLKRANGWEECGDRL